MVPVVKLATRWMWVVIIVAVAAVATGRLSKRLSKRNDGAVGGLAGGGWNRRGVEYPA
jgi:hypothetical protein